MKTYLRPRSKILNIDDEFAGIFLELDLIEELDRRDDGMGIGYRIASREREEIPSAVILFCILSNPKYGSSVSFYDLLNGVNSVDAVFALTADGLMQKIDEITRTHKGIIYKDDSGIREVQFKRKPDPWEVLKGYYED